MFLIVFFYATVLHKLLQHRHPPHSAPPKKANLHVIILAGKPRNNKRQTFDMYLHKTNDCARPYEKLANISGSLFSHLAAVHLYFPWDIRGRSFDNPTSRCIFTLSDLYLNLKLSILFRCDARSRQFASCDLEMVENAEKFLSVYIVYQKCKCNI